MKRYVLFAIVLFLISFVSALSTTNVNFENKKYDIEFMTSADNNNAVVMINNISKLITPLQSSPYNFYIFSQNFPEMKYAMSHLNHPSYYTGNDETISLLVLFEKTLKEGEKTSLSYNGKNYDIELVNIKDTNYVTLRVNEDSKLINPAQEFQPYYMNYPFSSSNPDIKYVINKIYISNIVGVDRNASFLFGFEVNLSIECKENWKCSAWSNCSNLIQTRNCTETNNCRTNKNKPELSRTCSENNPIICYEDKDCIVPESMSKPFCEEDKLCDSSSIQKCINPKTTSSYCNYSSLKTCNACENGCSDGECITNLVKECDPIGIRKDGKYCSLSNKWTLQKSNGVKCENDFECKINDCLNEKCGSVNPNFSSNLMITYSLAGIVIVIIFIAIAYLIVKKRK